MSSATALDFLPLAEMKRNLRIEPGDTSQDDLIEGNIEEAISFIERRASRVIVNQSKVLNLIPPASSMTLLLLPGRDILSVGEVKYWTTSGALRDDPNGTVTGLGRFFNSVNTSQNSYVYPPTAGWPEVLSDSCLQVTVNLGLDDPPAGIKSAAILVARQLYDGYAEIRPTAAFEALLAPWVRWGTHGSS